MSRSRSLLLVLALTSVVLPACGSGGSSGDASGHTVLVDYNHDEFAGSFLAYFPRVLKARPGDTITFKQAWTGEPHSVTFGTSVDKMLATTSRLEKQYPNGEGAPPEALEEYENAGKDQPGMIGDDNVVSQAAAQPCYLDEGMPPGDPGTPCKQRSQPPFDGKQTYYSSGFIPYQGNNGNKFEMTLADDIEPGTYNYFCNLHWTGMSGQVVVEPDGKAVPSQSENDRVARREIDKMATPLIKAYADAKKGKGLPPEAKGAHQAGFFSQKVQEAFVSEFIPTTIRAKAGEKVSWYIEGHTVSFDVPKYLPIFTIKKDGTVSLNPKAFEPINSPKPPPSPPGEEDEGGPGSGSPPVPIDAGKWGGKGFISSGLVTEGSEIWSLTFTKKGTFQYACLIHPRMIGKVVVS